MDVAVFWWLIAAIRSPQDALLQMPYGIGTQKGIKPVEVLESICYNDAPKIIVMTPGGLFGKSQMSMNGQA
jgi:hypothetical protein